MKPTHYCLKLDELIFGYTDATGYCDDRDVYYNPHSSDYTADKLIVKLKNAMSDITEDDGCCGDFHYFIEASLYPYGTCYFTLGCEN
jgi:hypothetical protein